MRPEGLEGWVNGTGSPCRPDQACVHAWVREGGVVGWGQLLGCWHGSVPHTSVTRGIACRAGGRVRPDRRPTTQPPTHAAHALRAGTLRTLMEGHSSPLFCLRFNRKGDLLLSGGVDKAVIVWEVKSGGWHKLLPGLFITMFIGTRQGGHRVGGQVRWVQTRVCEC